MSENIIISNESERIIKGTVLLTLALQKSNMQSISRVSNYVLRGMFWERKVCASSSSLRGKMRNAVYTPRATSDDRIDPFWAPTRARSHDLLAIGVPTTVHRITHAHVIFVPTSIRNSRFLTYSPPYHYVTWEYTKHSRISIFDEYSITCDFYHQSTLLVTFEKTFLDVWPITVKSTKLVPASVRLCTKMLLVHNELSRKSQKNA